jgi:hypothetical protein
MDIGSNLVGFDHVNKYNIESMNFKCKLYMTAKEELITTRND